MKQYFDPSAEIDLEKPLYKPSYKTFYAKPFFLMHNFDRLTRTSTINSQDIDFKNHFIFKTKKSLELNNKMFKNKPFTSIYQYEWIDKLYKEKRLPASLHYRIGFVQKEFNWDLLLKNICITITKKLFLEGTKIVRDAGINLISEMANEINKIVDEVEENLSQFGLQMEQNLMATMHLCVLLSIWRESEEKQWNELYNPIDEMIRSKDTQWIAFEAALSGNHQEACKTVAEKIFMKIEKCYHQMKIEETNDKFDTIVEKEKDKLSRNSIQDSKDKQYIFSNKTNVDKGLDYLDHFIEIIQECFEKDWSALIESFFDEQNNAIHTASRVFFNDIEEKVVQLENDLEEKKLTIPTSMLFAIDNDHEESDCTQFQTQVEQTAMIYFHEYLSGIKTNTWYIGEIKIMTHPDIQGRLPQPATGISYESSKFVKREYFEQEVVLRLDLLCKYFIEQIQNAKRGWKNYNVFENEKVNEHVGNKKLQMKRLALGCDARCPTCKRFCDVDHGDIIAGSIESKHACQKGHQIRALAGNKLFDNEASVFTCEEMQFDDPITYKDEKMTWDKFIETVAIGSTKCWDFKDLLDKRAEHIVDIRYIDFWRMVGKEFCERETETGNEMLMCVDSNKSKLSKSNKNIIHAILALDASGIIYSSLICNLFP